MLAAAAPTARASHPLATPAVWAHRGGRLEAPENTLGAFRKAAALFRDRGAPVNLELDVHLSSDGVPMVIHDATLDRTTTCTGRVDAFTASELAACDASESFPGWGAFEPVPTLAQVLDTALSPAEPAPWNLMIEIKGVPGDPDFDPLGDAAEAVIDVLGAKTFPQAQTIIQSFWPPSIERVELRAPGIRTMLLTTSTLPGAPEGVGFNLLENATFSTVRGYEIAAPDHETPDMSTAAVAYAHALGRAVVTWTVNDASAFATLTAFGVDGIITDRPSAFTAVHA